MVFAGCGINFYQAQKYKIILNRTNFRGIFLHFLFYLAKYLKKHAKLAILASLACFYYLAFG